MSWQDLAALPQVERAHTLACIDNPPGGSLIGNACWGGVLFSQIMDRISLSPGATRAKLCGWDGYATAVDLDWLLRPDTLLATQMNGRPLSLEHGFPARILIPGLYGQKMPKWLQRIEFIAYDFKGHWESQGSPDAAILRPYIRVDVPVGSTAPGDRVELSGVALAGLDEALAVDVRIDGGPWIPAEVERRSMHEWARWSLIWRPDQPGWYQFEARARTGSGEASGIHQAIVQVLA